MRLFALQISETQTPTNRWLASYWILTSGCTFFEPLWDEDGQLYWCSHPPTKCIFRLHSLSVSTHSAVPVCLQLDCSSPLPTPHSQLWFCGHAIAPKPCITASFNCYEWGIQLRFGNRLLACLLSLSSTHSSSASISHTNYEAGFECVWVPFFHCTLNSQLSPN